MGHSLLRRVSVFASAFAALSYAATAHATNVTEFPDNGSEQEGRGGAWVARASDPLAAFYNPAGLAGQETRITVQANIAFRHTCFTRVAAANDTTVDRLADPTTGLFPRVCNDIAPFVDPQIGFTWRVTDRIGLGFLPLLAPSSVGSVTYPEFVNGVSPNLPAPNRYLLTNANGVIVTPTLGAGFEVIDGLRLGASFQVGIAPKLHFENASAAVNGPDSQPASNDVKAAVDVKDMFFPGFTLGALYSATDDIDIAGWYKWSAPIDAKGDLQTSVNYYTPAVASGNTKGVQTGDTSKPDCGIPGGMSVCGSNTVSIKIPVPMEAKLGFRYHKSRAAGSKHSHLRDPMSQDVFDVEADLTWANNSSFSDVQIRFPSDMAGNGIIPVNGIPGSVVPPNADVPHQYKDVFGIRLGGDYNVLADKLALRAGAFFETRGQDPTYQNIDFPGAERYGVSVGGTYRLHLSAASKRALEFHLGYGHVFYGTFENDSRTAQGINGLSGGQCNSSDMFNGATGQCQTSTGQTYPKYRTQWPVNLGTVTNALNVINVGVSYRF